MKVTIISPLFPDAQVVLSEADLHNEINFADIWSRIDLEGKLNLLDLEVELCELQNPNPSVFPLSSPIQSLPSSTDAVLSIDLKGNDIRIFHI